MVRCSLPMAYEHEHIHCCLQTISWMTKYSVPNQKKKWWEKHHKKAFEWNDCHRICSFPTFNRKFTWMLFCGCHVTRWHPTKSKNENVLHNMKIMRITRNSFSILDFIKVHMRSVFVCIPFLLNGYCYRIVSFLLLPWIFFSLSMEDWYEWFTCK